MAAEARPALARDRTLAFAAATIAHALVLFLLIWRLGGAPPLAEAPTMNVELMRRAHKPAPQSVRRSPDRRAGARPSATPRPPKHATPADQEAPGVPAPPASEPGGDMRRALRSLLGCQHAALAHLSADERRLCLERMAAAGAAEPGGGKLNLDIQGRYGRDPEPYLNRRPRNGCKARAAGDVSVMGQQGAAAGVDCAWSF